MKNPFVGLVSPVLNRVEQLAAGNWDAPGNRDRVGEVSILARHRFVELRQVEEKREGHGRGREENVVGEVEFFGDIKGVCAEEIDDKPDKLHAGGQGAEGVAEGGEGSGDGEGNYGFDFGALWEVIKADWREEDMVDGGWQGFEDGLLGFCGKAVAGDYECDGEVVKVDESFGELGEWDEVAHAWSRENCYVRCLRFCHGG